MVRFSRSLTCAIGLTGCLLSFFLVFCNPVVSDEPEEKNPKVKELEQKRLAVLEEIHELAKKAFADGVISHEQLHDAKAALLSARLDYADSKQDRIKICDEGVKEAKEWHKIVREGVVAKAYSRIDELKAESDLLEAQITRANEDEE